MPQIKVYLDDELLVVQPLDIRKTCVENQSRTSRSTTPQKRSVVIIDKKDLREIPYPKMVLGMRYYYIDVDGTIKRGAYIKFDETNQRKPYIIQKDPEFITQDSQFAFVDRVYLREASTVINKQSRSGGKKRRTRRGKKSSRKSRKNK